MQSSVPADTRLNEICAAALSSFRCFDDSSTEPWSYPALPGVDGVVRAASDRKGEARSVLDPCAAIAELAFYWGDLTLNPLSHLQFWVAGGCAS